jgi:hypothetical protein
MGKKGRRLFEVEVEVEDWKSRRLLKERIIKRELGKLTATRSSTEREIGKEGRAGLEHRNMSAKPSSNGFYGRENSFQRL